MIKSTLNISYLDVNVVFHLLCLIGWVCLFFNISENSLGKYLYYYITEAMNLGADQTDLMECLSQYI